ncbi:hypothetical protein LCGC14_1255580 [marine sediment metagenome]|uniref:Uncharacterized protein n=1 Tax=marine sediment metagenome TaxID=412755 RepID=A0A0F9NIT9_9ZZZZ
MPCTPIKDGILCTGNRPFSIKHKGKIFSFEWTAASGWCPVNSDGSERLSPVPAGAWDKFLDSTVCQAYERTQRIKEKIPMTADSAIYRVSTQVHPTEINIVLAREIERLREERVEFHERIKNLEEELNDAY